MRLVGEDHIERVLRCAGESPGTPEEGIHAAALHAALQLAVVDAAGRLVLGHVHRRRPLGDEIRQEIDRQHRLPGPRPSSDDDGPLPPAPYRLPGGIHDPFEHDLLRIDHDELAVPLHHRREHVLEGFGGSEPPPVDHEYRLEIVPLLQDVLQEPFQPEAVVLGEHWRRPDVDVVHRIEQGLRIPFYVVVEICAGFQ